MTAQITLRNSRRLAAAMRSSRIPAIKTLADFDFSFQPSIKREQIDALHELGSAERKENVVFLSPPGAGKISPGHQPDHRDGRKRPKGLLRHPDRPDRLPRGGPGRRNA